MKTLTFGTVARILASTSSSSSCPWWTVHPPGTSTWNDTNRLAPDWRVRSAWYWTPSFKWLASAAFTSASSSAGKAVSISPRTDRRTMPKPVRTMFAATAIATIGSSRSQPVAATANTPTMTPTEVQTSVRRCWASASSVMEWYALPTRSRTSATARLTMDATTDTARPMPTCSMGLGAQRRLAAATAMLTAARRIRVPSTPLEKYSALEWPYAWSSSSGLAATVSIVSAMTAPTRLTIDSMASDRSPTEPVSAYATDLSVMVVTAAAIDSHA